MDTYIGLDAHVSSCTLGVLGPSGKRLELNSPPAAEKERAAHRIRRLRCHAVKEIDRA